MLCIKYIKSKSLQTFVCHPQKGGLVDSCNEGKEGRAEQSRKGEKEKNYVPGVTTLALKPDVSITTISCEDFFVAHGFLLSELPCCRHCRNILNLQKFGINQ